MPSLRLAGLYASNEDLDDIRDGLGVSSYELIKELERAAMVRYREILDLAREELDDE